MIYHLLSQVEGDGVLSHLFKVHICNISRETFGIVLWYVGQNDDKNIALMKDVDCWWSHSSFLSHIV